MTIKIGNSLFSATLQDNPTAKAFAQILPLTVPMEELNGNEKFYFLPNNLPSAESAIGKIEAGDIMLYGRNCLVVFYASFKTSYKYTRIGKIDQPEGLVEALGAGTVIVIFDPASASTP